MQLTFLTTIDLAKLLHVSPKTLERKRMEGNGPAFMKSGRRVLYSTSEIEKWLAENTFSSTSQYPI